MSEKNNGVEATEQNAEIESVQTETPVSEDDVSANESEKADNEAKEEPEKKFEEWPSTAKTAVRNRDRKYAKAQAELNQLRQQLEELKAAQSQPKAENNEPREEDFEDYASFLEARILHKMQSQKGGEQSQPEQKIDLQEQLYIQQREQLMAQKSQEYAQSIPDYQQVISENVEILGYMPPHIQRVFFDADDAALATYNLAKSGELADLMQMSPIQAAMKIAQAQTIKPQLTPSVPKHKPMQGAKGTAQVRDEDRMSGKELLSKYGVY